MLLRQTFQASPFLKGGVVEFASLVELVLEELNLGLVRVETVWVAEAHKQSIQRASL